MTPSEATTIRRGARWLLLLGTLLGLAAMHTLGHSGMRMDTHRGASLMGSAPMLSASATLPRVVEASAAALSACTDDHCGDDAMSGWSICLAVLSGLAVFALLAALLLVGRRERGWVRDTPSSAAGLPRAPPARRAGLTLTSTAVLRL